MEHMKETVATTFGNKPGLIPVQVLRDDITTKGMRE